MNFILWMVTVAYIPTRVGFLSSSCITCFCTFAFKCSFDGGDTVDGYIIYDFNIYIHDHHSTATDAVKLREIFTRLQFQVIHSLRREPSLVPLAVFFLDGTGHMKIWFMFCWDYWLIARINCSIDRTWDCRFFSTFSLSLIATGIESSPLEPFRHSRWTLEKKMVGVFCLPICDLWGWTAIEIRGMKRFMMAIHLRFPGITSQVLGSLVVGKFIQVWRIAENQQMTILHVMWKRHVRL